MMSGSLVLTIGLYNWLLRVVRELRLDFMGWMDSSNQIKVMVLSKCCEF